MTRTARSHYTFAAAVLALLAGASSAHAVVLFADDFTRADSRNIDAGLGGITNNTGSALPIDGVYTHPYLDPANDPGPQDGDASNGGGARILNNQLQLAVGAGTSNAFVNHNFTNASILTDGAFSVSLDVLGYGGASNGQGGGFAVGMSQAEALTAMDAFSGAAKFTNAFNGGSSNTAFSDFWIGLRGDGTLAWGSGAVQPGDVGFYTSAVGMKTGTISANFGVSSFGAGSSVNYEVFFNGASKGVGSFVWSGANENYIALDGRDGAAVSFDNFLVQTSAPPAVPSVTIDRDTGRITLLNETNQPLSMTIYSLTSSSGGFNQANWETIQSQGIDTNDDWIKLTNPTSTTDLSEGTLGEYTLGSIGTATDEIDLGMAWIPSPFEDVQIELRDAAGNDVPVIVRYVGNGGQALGLADFNHNGVVDAGDWPNVRDNLISDVSGLQPIQAYLAGDINTDGVVNSADFRQFKTLYEADNGVGSFAALLAVPEPASLLTVLAGLLVLGARRGARSCLTAALLAVGFGGSFAEQACAVNLFTDTFTRADSQNIDGALGGITNNTGSSLGVDGVYTHGQIDPNNDPGPVDGDAANGGGARILSNGLQLAVGAGTSNAFISHNFTNASILTDGGFRVSLDVNGFTQASNGQGGAFAIGMSQAAAASSGDAVNGLPSNAKFTNAFTGGSVNVISDFWLGLRGDNTLAWGFDKVAPNAGVVNVGAKTGTISATFATTGFNAGDSVAYEVFYNGVSQGSGAFAWSQDMANYIGVDARDSVSVQLDNFAIDTVTNAAINPLRLQVDTASGAVSIAGGDVANNLDFYEIQSAGSGLLAGAFVGIGGKAGLPDGNGTGNGWELGGVQTSSLLNEAYLQASSTIAAGAAAVSLGNVYNTALNTHDIAFYYESSDGGRHRGFVEYVTNMLPDFNSNGIVDAADYTIWRDNSNLLTGATFAQGDANGDGAVNGADYQIWKSQYGAVATSAANAVPEPAALAIVACGLIGLVRRRTQG